MGDTDRWLAWLAILRLREERERGDVVDWDDVA